MILKRGDMFKQETDILLVTTNSVINKRGRLVMGRGAALQLSSILPDSSMALACMIESVNMRNDYGDGAYGVLMQHMTVPGLCRLGYGAFQVKDKWWEDASLGLIEFSTTMLQVLCASELKNKLISLNFPGIGNGRLKREDVLPIIQALPNQVTVWEKG